MEPSTATLYSVTMRVSRPGRDLLPGLCHLPLLVCMNCLHQQNRQSPGERQLRGCPCFYIANGSDSTLPHDSSCLSCEGSTTACTSCQGHDEFSLDVGQGLAGGCGGSPHGSSCRAETGWSSPAATCLNAPRYDVGRRLSSWASCCSAAREYGSKSSTYSRVKTIWTPPG
jgi:hypothetical protein